MTPDLLILGGGVIGLSLADCALRSGLSVTVIDKSRAGTESSWAGAGMLTNRPRPRQKEGQPDFHDLRQYSVTLYKEWAPRLKEETGIDTGYRVCGALELFGPDGGYSAENIRSFLEGGKSRGVTVRQLNAREIRALEPHAGESFSGALEFPDEAQVRNPWLVRALLASVRAKGGVILEETAAADLLVNAAADKVDGVRLVSGETLAAGNVAVCAGAWAGQIPALVNAAPVVAKIHPVRGQLLCYEASPDLARRLLTCDRHYIVPRGDGVYLVGATHDKVGFDKSTTDAAQQELEIFGQALLPELKKLRPVKTWAGLRPALSGQHPLLGAVPKLSRLYVALGHFRNGLTLAPATAELVMAEILKKTPKITLGSWAVQ